MSQAPSGPQIPPEEEAAANAAPETAETPETPETPEQEYQARQEDSAAAMPVEEVPAPPETEEAPVADLPPGEQMDPGQAAAMEAVRRGTGEPPPIDMEAIRAAADQKETPQISGISDEELEERRRDELPMFDRMVENYHDFYEGEWTPEWLDAGTAIADRPLRYGFLPKDQLHSMAYLWGVGRGGGKMLLSVNNMILGGLGYSPDELPHPDVALGVSNSWAPALVEGFTQYGLTALMAASGVYALAPAGAALPAGFTPAIAGVGGDVVAFDPRQGGIVTVVREFLPEGSATDEWLKGFDPRYMTELTGTQRAGRGVLGLEGIFMTLTFAGFMKGSSKAAHGFDAMGRKIGGESVTTGQGGMPSGMPGMPTAEMRFQGLELPPEIANIKIPPEAAKHFAKHTNAVVLRGLRAEELYATGMPIRDVIETVNREFGQTAKELHDEHYIEGAAHMLVRATRDTVNPLTLNQARTHIQGYHRAGMHAENTFFVSPDISRQADEAIARRVLDPEMPERVLLQEGPEGVRGRARIDPTSDEAFIHLYETSTVDTLHEEVGHVIRGQLTGPKAKHLAKSGKGVLSEAEITRVEEVYGVEGGKWTKDQEEAFAADMRAFILEGKDNPELNKEFQWMAAHLRDVIGDARNSPLSNSLTDASRTLWGVLQNKRKLPIRYDGNKYVPSIEWSAVTAKIKEMEDGGEDWSSLVTPETLLGNQGLRTTINNKGDLLRYMAIWEDLAREIREKDILFRPKSDTDLTLNSYRLYAEMTGQDVDEAVAFLSMTNHTTQDMDDQVLAGNLMLVAEAQKLMNLRDVADASKSVTDMALLQRQYIQFQRISNAVARLRTQTGRALRAYKWPGHLPSEKALRDDQGLAQQLIESARGNAKPGEASTLAGQDLIDALMGLKIVDDARVITDGVQQANHGIGTRFVGIFHEMYVNGLLSSPSTVLGISTASPLAIMLGEGASKLAYSGIMGIVNRKQREVFVQTIKNIGRHWNNRRQAAKYAIEAFKREEGVLMGAKARLDDAAYQRHATRWGYEGDNGFLQGLSWLINKGGEAIRLPSRGIITVDEFFRQMNARTGVQEELLMRHRDQAIKEAQNNGLIPFKDGPDGATGRNIDRNHPLGQEWLRQPEIVDMVNARSQKQYNDVIRDGRIRTQSVLLEESRAKPEIQEIENPVERGFAMAEYIDREYRLADHDVIKHAEARATNTVLQDDLGVIGKHVQKVLDYTIIGRVLVPFYRTPTNALKRGMVYFSPASLGVEGLWRIGRTFSGKGWKLDPNSSTTLLYQKHMADLASGDPRRVAEARAKQIAGTALMSSVLVAAESGHITGGGPRDPDLRRAWLATGWRPYSFKIGGVYISYAKMDPAATVLGMTADFAELHMDAGNYGDQEEKMGLAAVFIISAGNQIHNKSMLQGISDAITVMDRPDGSTAEAYGRRLATTITPGMNIWSSFQRTTSQTSDQLREARSILDQYRMTSWLGDRTLVAPRYNAIGEPVDRDAAATPTSVRYTNWFNPMKISVEDDDVVIRGLAEIGEPDRPPPETQYGLDLTTVPGIGGEHSAYESYQKLVGLPREDPDAILLLFQGSEKGDKPQYFTLRELLATHMVEGADYNTEWNVMVETTDEDFPSDSKARTFVREQKARYRLASLQRLTGYKEVRGGKRVEHAPLIPALAASKMAASIRAAKQTQQVQRFQGASPTAQQKTDEYIQKLEGERSQMEQSERARQEEITQP